MTANPKLDWWVEYKGKRLEIGGKLALVSVDVFEILDDRKYEVRIVDISLKLNGLLMLCVRQDIGNSQWVNADNLDYPDSDRPTVHFECEKCKTHPIIKGMQDNIEIAMDNLNKTGTLEGKDHE